MDYGAIWKYVGLFIGVVVLFLIVAELYPVASDAGDTLRYFRKTLNYEDTRLGCL